MCRDLGDVAMRGRLFGCGGLLALLMRLPFVLSSSATADGRMSAATMP